MNRPEAPRPPKVHPVRAALPSVLAVALLVLAVRWFGARWDAVVGGGPAPAVAWHWLGVAFLLLVMHAGSSLVLWRQLLRAVGSPLTWREATDAFTPFLLARYIPGKIWANTARLVLARRAGVRYGATTGALLWETLIVLGSAGLVALAGLASSAEGNTMRAAVLLVAGTAGAWGVVGVLARHPRGTAILGRLGGTAPVSSPATLAPALGTALVGWCFFGAAHLAVARSVAPVALLDGPLVAGAMALAWAGGYLAIVMPLGLGVRDGILLVLLASLLDPAQALLFVALSRLVQVAVDTVLTAVWFVARSGRRRDRPGAAPAS